MMPFPCDGFSSFGFSNSGFLFLIHFHEDSTALRFPLQQDSFTLKNTQQMGFTAVTFPYTFDDESSV